LELHADKQLEATFQHRKTQHIAGPMAITGDAQHTVLKRDPAVKFNWVLIY